MNKKDYLLIAGLIGGLSTLTGEIATTLLVAFGIGQHAVYELNSLIVTINRPDILMGFIVNYIVGSFIGSLLYLSFRKYGNEHLVVKSIMVSLLVWLIYEFVFTCCIETRSIPLRPFSDYYVHLAGTAIYGASAGILYKVLLFNKRETK